MSLLFKKKSGDANAKRPVSGKPSNAGAGNAGSKVGGAANQDKGASSPSASADSDKSGAEKKNEAPVLHQWTCHGCTYVNFSASSNSAVCKMCSQPGKNVSVGKAWVCAECTFANPAVQNDTCEVCNTERRNPLVPVVPVVVEEPKLPSAPPKFLRQTSSFLSAVQAVLGPAANPLKPQMLQGLENIARTPWGLCEERLSGAKGLEVEWLAVVRKSLIELALRKATRSVELWQELAHLSAAEDLNLKGRDCALCRKQGHEVELLVSESCKSSHPVCQRCMHDYVMDLVNKGKCSVLRCPVSGCNQEFDTRLLRDCLTSVEFEKFSDAALQEYIGGDADMVKCPNPKCGQFMAVVTVQSVEIPILITEKDARGVTLTPTAYEHYMCFRMRCRDCQTNFCKECKLTPYHMGFTCDEYVKNLSAKHCRFCHNQLTPDHLAANPPSPALIDVCDEKDCVTRREACCVEMLPCGHPCGGFRGEEEHLVCLVDACAEINKCKQKADDFCQICFVEDIAAAPAIQLQCGHVFHEHCARDKCQKGWPGVRITFGFLNCPVCKQEMNHPRLEKVKEPWRELYKLISEKSLVRLEIDGMMQDKKLIDPTSRFYRQPLQYALASFAYYNCYKCKKPYFGGRRDCEQNADADTRPLSDFICFDCADLVNPRACKIAGHAEYIAWKCRFCCNQAVWFCFGTTHFCDPCHSHDPMEKTKRDRSGFKQCPGPDSCPIKGHHAPNGKEQECEFAVGCALCMDEERKRALAHKQEKEIEAKIQKEKHQISGIIQQDRDNGGVVNSLFDKPLPAPGSAPPQPKNANEVPPPAPQPPAPALAGKPSKPRVLFKRKAKR